MPIVRTLDLDTLTLERGSHHPNGRFCVMEAVAYVAGEPWSDAPECCSPVIGAFLRRWNDDLDDAGRQILKPYVPRLVGTRGSDATEQTRSWLAADWLVRECTPVWLDAAGLTEEAAALRSLPQLQYPVDLDRAMPAIQAARDKADAARAAARDAAWDAARAAAWDAAREKLRTVVATLQPSALGLLDRMIAA